MRLVTPTLRTMALTQAAFYLLTGLWAIVSIGTFQTVTGPKTDLWLVKTVGALVGVVGAVLGIAAGRRKVDVEMATLACGSAASLAAIDVVYVARRRISRIYLLDAVAECGLIAAWLIAWRRR
jgi:hypothetical protein